MAPSGAVFYYAKGPSLAGSRLLRRNLLYFLLYFRVRPTLAIPLISGDGRNVLNSDAHVFWAAYGCIQEGADVNALFLRQPQPVQVFHSS